MAAEYVEGPLLSSIYTSNPLSFSGEFWFRSNVVTPANGTTLLGSSSNFSTKTDGFGLFMNGSNAMIFWVNSFTGFTVSSAVLANLNTEHKHVAFSSNGTTLTLWVDGLSASNSPAPGAMVATGTQNFRVGATGNLNPASTLTWNGQISEVALYDVALTVADVDTLRTRRRREDHATLKPLSASQVLYYRFDPRIDDATIGTGNVRDQTGNGHDGTFQTLTTGVGSIETSEIPTPVVVNHDAQRNANNFFMGE